MRVALQGHFQQVTSVCQEPDPVMEVDFLLIRNEGNLEIVTTILIPADVCKDAGYPQSTQPAVCLITQPFHDAQSCMLGRCAHERA
jgi:hypothetical protein